MDRNTIIGFSLIFLILIGFYFYTKPTEEQMAAQQKTADSLALVEEKAEKKRKVQASQEAQVENGEKKSSQNDSVATVIKGNFVSAAEERSISIKNKDIKIDFSTKGGEIKQIELLNHKSWDGKKLKMLNENLSQMYFLINTPGGALKSNFLNWEVANSTDRSVSFRLKNTDSGYIEQSIELAPEGHAFDFKLRLKNVQNDIYRGNSDLVLVMNTFLNKQEKDKKWEELKSTISYKLDGESPDDIGSGDEEEEKIKGKTQWFSFNQQYFNITMANPEGFDTDGVLKLKKVEEDSIVRDMEVQMYLNYNLEDDRTYALRMYAGPSEYKTLSKVDLGIKDAQLEEVVPLGWGIFGWLNKYLVMPIFNVLSNNIAATGLAIILLTLIIKFLLLPLVYKSYISTAKMRILKPEIEKIKEKHKDLQKQQQENMALYKKAGVSPMSGCVPLLFQMPVLFAMFQFFPSAFQLRQKSFLWAEDLSRYDSVFDIGFNVPMYGDHISLFTLLMTLSTLLYTHFNNQITGATGQMKYIGYIMPVIFLGVLNDYASGLTLYYLVSNLITFGQQWVIRKRVNDDKLRAQIALARKKPAKKSRFQARMEEAMKQQQQRKRK